MKRTPAPDFSRHLQFVTTRTHQRLPLFRRPQLCRQFLQALLELRETHSFELFAYVIMPDHVHLLVRPADGRISNLMKQVKSLSARRILESLKASQENALLSNLKKGSIGRRRHTYKVWQDGFHAVSLWSGWMVRKKIDYLHGNPLRKGLAESAKDYPWSSFATFHGFRRGKIALDPIPN